MKKELQDWINGMFVSIQNAIDRMNNDTLSVNDKNLLGVSLIQLSQELKRDPEYENNSAYMDELSQKLSDCFSSLMSNDVAKLQENKDELRQIYMFGDVLLSKEDYDKFQPREDGRTYIDLSNLPEMSREKFMEYVDRLKSLGAKFDKELKQWYVEKDWTPSEAQNIIPDYSPEAANKKTEKKQSLKKVIEKNKDLLESNLSTIGKAQKILEYVEKDKDLYNNEERNLIVNYAFTTDNIEQAIELMDLLVKAENGQERSQIFNDAQQEIDLLNANEEVMFKAIYYDSSERKEIYAGTLEQALKEASKSKGAIKESERCYIQKYDAKSDSYKQEGIYLLASGKDITPVELKLPYMSQKTFMDVKENIKSMGAKFNNSKKMWYVERSVGQETIDIINDYLDKHDEATYLKLPSVSPDEFKKIVAQIKEAGAKYNGDKKAWYITDRVDQSKFADYLDEGKKSVREKLGQYKAAADGQKMGNEHEIEARNKDNRER